MKTPWIAMLVALSLVGATGAASAQWGSDYGYEEREYGGRSYAEQRYWGRNRGYEEEEYGRGYDDDDDDDEALRSGRRYDDDRGYKRGRGDREQREVEFDEDEYLRCHPDVRRAVKRGEMASGAFHYKMFGRREGRRITCVTRL